MAQWEAANIPSQRNDWSEQYDNADNVTFQNAASQEDDNSNAKKSDDKIKPSLSSIVARRKSHNSSEETIEARIARLSSSYSTAMKAVGALHRTSSDFVKTKVQNTLSTNSDSSNISASNSISALTGQSVDTTKNTGNDNSQKSESKQQQQEDQTHYSMMDHQYFTTMKRVSKAARDVFENCILSDMSLQPFIPTFSRCISMIHNEKQKIHTYSTPILNHTCDYQTTPSFSTAHQGQVKEIAYLSLVNYADLLLCGCTCTTSLDVHTSKQYHILDKGVIPILEALKIINVCKTTLSEHDKYILESHYHKETCLWKDLETEEQTKRLALVAYCDAVDLDDSDPMTWLKVACAARSLGRVISRHSQDSIDSTLDGHDYASHTLPIFSYHKLERYALERGLKSLRPGIPPNRIISRAFEESKLLMIGDYHQIPQYSSYGDKVQHEQVNLVIDLPRNSWSALGRLLMKAHRDCSKFYLASPWVTSPSPSHDLGQTSNYLSFGSPSICLKISPMLTLPANALINICDYLGDFTESKNISRDIKALECTCRSLSTDIISNRASVEHERHLRLTQIEQEMTQNRQSMLTQEVTESSQSIILASGEKESKHPQALNNGSESRSCRSSTRVRTQLITSGKQANRSAQRKSVEYCLAKAIFGCTPDHPTYKAALKDESFWMKLFPPSSRNISTSPKSDDGGEEEEVPSPIHRTSSNVKSHMEESFLLSTIAKWNERNSGPHDVLHRFLLHVSFHVNEVYISERGDLFSLTSCIYECFQTLIEKPTSICPSWYGSEFLNKSDSFSIDHVHTLAINLLHAELMMKRCERLVSLENNGYDSELNSVKAMIPYLLNFSEYLHEIEYPKDLRNLILGLRVRTNWLVAVFFVWWSKNVSDWNDIEKSEKMAMEHINAAIAVFELNGISSFTSVPTPHLVSPGRSGDHWCELSVRTLCSYRNELESSTVLSHSRRKLRDLFIQLQDSGRSSITELSEKENDVISNVSAGLLDRYQLDLSYETKNVDELINDFLIFHGNNFMQDDMNQQDPAEDISMRSQEDWGSLWSVIPSKSTDAFHLTSVNEPTLISMLCFCFSTKSNYLHSMVYMLGQLIISTLQERQQNMTDQKKKDPNNSHAIMTLSDQSESSSYDSSDEDSVNNFQSKRKFPGKHTSYLNLIEYFLLKLIDVISHIEYGDIDLNFVLMVVQRCLEAATGMKLMVTKNDKSPSLYINLKLFNMTLSLISAVTKRPSEPDRIYVMSRIFQFLVGLLIMERNQLLSLIQAKGLFKLSRVEHQNLCEKHGKLCSLIGNEVASILSIAPHILQQGRNVEESSLLTQVILFGSSNVVIDDSSVSPFIQFIESLSWYWNFIVTAGVLESLEPPSAYIHQSNSVERKVAKQISTSIAAVIVSVCGSIGDENSEAYTIFNLKKGDHYEQKKESDDWDSDDSIQDWGTGTSRCHVSSDRTFHMHQNLLKMISLIVQCIGLVYSGIDDRSASTNYSSKIVSLSRDVSLSGLVANVLANLSDYILMEFRDEDVSVEEAVWNQKYPYGLRSTGAQMDLLLHKAYRCLYNVNILSNHYQNALRRDAIVPPPCTSVVESSNNFRPGSIRAAAQLYRCLMRAYENSRKSVPQDALECVASVLPSQKEDDNYSEIKKFIFCANGKYDQYIDSIELSDIFQSDSNHDGLPVDFPSIVSNSNSLDESDDHEEVEIMRKKICYEFAEGPLPQIGVDMSEEAYKTNSEREMAAATEYSMKEKFHKIIETLRYDPKRCESWYRASLCLQMKADIILDRLITPKESYDANDFFIPKFYTDQERISHLQSITNTTRDLPLLLKLQYEEYKKSNSLKVPFLGADLSLYIDFAFCDLSSLKSFPAKLLPSLQSPEERKAWNSIMGLYEEGKLSEWQQAWGGLFVSALQFMSKRCLRVALYFADNSDEVQPLLPDILEALGTAYYGELMGSIDVGFPLSILSDHEKRKKANIAKALFLKRAEYAYSINEKPWDIQFMIGKCYEKIAMSLKGQSFHSNTGDTLNDIQESRPRRYFEVAMSSALKCYTTSLSEYESTGGDKKNQDIKVGGSSHGVIEIFYRVHATRLKILLLSAKASSSDREYAEAEALKLVENHWYEKPEQTYGGHEAKDTKNRIWMVFADIVSALAYCRKQQPFFHRSVYRHAQALLWAPFLDSDCDLKDGSLSSVSLSKCYKIRGLNSSSSGSSAEAVIQSLFEKKRPQLCAVWVTTQGECTPFEILNEKIRKFDSLRLKYIRAYIDCMKLCQRRSSLETFISWCQNCRRDLPNFYALTADVNRDISQVHIMKENLLLEPKGFLIRVTRCANSAIADILLKESLSMIGHERTDEWQKDMKEKLISTLTCFQRLNCPVDDGVWQSQKVKVDLEKGNIIEVDCLCIIYGLLSDEGKSTLLKSFAQAKSWDEKLGILQLVTRKCESLLPSLVDFQLRKRKKKRPLHEDKVVDNMSMNENEALSMTQAAASIQDEIEYEDDVKKAKLK